MMDQLEPQEQDFSTIDAHIDPSTMETLCRMYVERTLHPASVSVYNELMTIGDDIQHALYRAVVNQAIIEALLQELNKPGQPIRPFNI